MTEITYDVSVDVTVACGGIVCGDRTQTGGKGINKTN